MSAIEFVHPMFSVNEYDRDGDLTEEGIFLHYGKTRVKVAETLNGWKEYVKYIYSMTDEIEENVR
jgi:hypothetical protein